MKKLSIITKGLIRENPVLVLVLGTCPALAITTSAVNALGMGAAATFVLVYSNDVISAVRNVVPDKVRIPCFIVFISGFVVLAEMIVEAFAYPLYLSIGIFLPLITVNCIIFGRAEMYANKNPVFNSVLDAVGMGVGFTLTILAMGSIREIIGAGTWFGFPLPVLSEFNIPLLAMAPGGFIVFGVLIAVVNRITKDKSAGRKGAGCANCPSAAACG